MRSRSMFTLVVVLTLLVAASASAQSSTETVTVQATVASVIEFNVTSDGTPTGSQVFDFGSVDALGQSAGNADTVTPDPTGFATYVKNGAFLWNFRSAPRGAGTITTAAGASTKTVGTDFTPDAVGRTSMALGQLSVRFTRTSANGTGTLTGAFTALTAAAQNWLTGATIGSGNGPLGGQAGAVDLQLTVDDLDQVETNEWQITFTANIT